MNIHEYQGKALLKQYYVDIQEGIVADSPEQAIEAAEQLTEITGIELFVIKAQIHAGGRGKGGGVKLARSVQDAGKIAGEMIGMNLVTPQTGPQGKRVNRVLVAQDVYYKGESKPREFYISLLLNRSTGRHTFMYSPAGGMSIEEVAEKTPS